MRIAVVGAGIAGLGAAWLLSPRHDVVLFEREARLGGHTDTHRIEVDGQAIDVDSGFIVYNPAHYPRLVALFAELGVVGQATTMSFSVHGGPSRRIYASTLAGLLLARPSQLLDRNYWRLLSDIVRFYRQAPTLLDLPGPGPSIADFLGSEGYSAEFANEHLLPMAAALWSAPVATVSAMPVRFLVEFMANHRMLDIGRRPSWYSVVGGSSRYIEAMCGSWDVEVRVATPVERIERRDQKVHITASAHTEAFDAVILATHADDSLALLSDADPQERDLLGAFRFRDNEAILHCDASLMPPARAAWAAWNYRIGDQNADACQVTYWMNALQRLPVATPVMVSLDSRSLIDPETIFAVRRYRHPLFDVAAVAAQSRMPSLQGHRQTWYAGAWLGHGFHEDGLASAAQVADAIGGSSR